jgi:hypothetical protein
MPGPHGSRTFAGQALGQHGRYTRGASLTFYDNAAGLVRVVVVRTLAYVWLLVVLRTTGKRTLAQLNAFDFIVTLALGSTLASAFLTATVSFTEGAIGLALLAILQFVVAWSAVRVRSEQDRIKVRSAFHAARLALAGNNHGSDRTSGRPASGSPSGQSLSSL